MMENTDNNRLPSDQAWLKDLGTFIKQNRLEKNISQEEIAEIAGINRTTISAIENGQGGTLVTFIQLLRALDLLDVLTVFQKKQSFSPIQLSKLQGKIPRRAGKRTKPKLDNTSEW